MSKKLYVGNLAYEVTEEDLKKNFGEIGECIEVNIIRDKYSGNSRGFGFVEMATEEEISGLFPDCETGAVPPLAEPYAVDAFVDDSLDEQPDIYVEGGDHRSLIHIPGSQFRTLTKNVRHARISAPA